jgi:hypothetical protein
MDDTGGRPRGGLLVCVAVHGGRLAALYAKTAPGASSIQHRKTTLNRLSEAFSGRAGTAHHPHELQPFPRERDRCRHRP